MCWTPRPMCKHVLALHNLCTLDWSLRRAITGWTCPCVNGIQTTLRRWSTCQLSLLITARPTNVSALIPLRIRQQYTLKALFSTRPSVVRPLIPICVTRFQCNLAEISITCLVVLKTFFKVRGHGRDQSSWAIMAEAYVSMVWHEGPLLIHSCIYLLQTCT